MKKIILLLCMVWMYNFTMAYQIMYGQNVLVSRPVRENIYIAGGSVTFNAPVFADIVVGGGTVIFNNVAATDILVLGGDITVNGNVAGNIRCFGGNVRILDTVRGDIFFAGGNLVCGKNSSVGNLVGVGGKLLLNGHIPGSVALLSGDLTVNGNIGDSIYFKGGKLLLNGTIGGTSSLSAETIMLGPHARFYKNVRYWNTDGTLNFAGLLVNATAIRDPALRPEVPRWYYLGHASMLVFFWYLLSTLAMAGIIQYLFSASMKKAGDTMGANPAGAIKYGLLAAIGIPVFIALLFVSVIGIIPGLFVLAFYILFSAGTFFITPVVIANYVNGISAVKRGAPAVIFYALLAFIGLRLLLLIPLVGIICLIVVTCWAYGSILYNLKPLVKYRKQRKARNL